MMASRVDGNQIEIRDVFIRNHTTKEDASMKGLKRYFSIFLSVCLVLSAFIPFSMPITNGVVYAAEQGKVESASPTITQNTIPEVSNTSESSSELPSQSEINQYKEDGTCNKRLSFYKNLVGAKSENASATSALSQSIMSASSSKLLGSTALNNTLAGPRLWQSGMPRTGTAKAAVFLVQFPDYINSDSMVTAESVQNMLFGTNNMEGYPYESLTNYYQRSSFGKLNIQGKVFGWYTAAHTRSYYETAGSDALMKEVINYYNQQGIDFSQFDGNNDGVMDEVFLNFSGPDTGWGSVWWSYVTSMQSKYSVNNKMVTKYSFIHVNASKDDYIKTYCHETGHFLGLPDYYNYDFWGQNGNSGGICGDDMMANNIGDQNAFSKLLLGWITPEEVQIITPNSTATKATLSNAAISPKVAIVANHWDASKGIFQEYFLLEYYDNKNNNASSSPSNGSVKILHVNAALDSSGYNFINDNSTTKNRLIMQVRADNQYNVIYANDPGTGFYDENDSFDMNTNPSTDYYDGVFTGINVKINSADNDNAVITVVRDVVNPSIPSIKYISPKESQPGVYTANLVPNQDNVMITYSSKVYLSSSTKVVVKAMNSGSVTTGQLKVKDDTLIIPINAQEGTNFSLTIPGGLVKNSYGNGNKSVTLKFSALNNYKAVSSKTIVDDANSIFMPGSTGCITASDSSRIVISDLTNNKLTFFKVKDGTIIKKVLKQESDPAHYDLTYNKDCYKLSEDRFVVAYERTRKSDGTAFIYFLLLDHNGTILAKAKSERAPVGQGTGSYLIVPRSESNFDLIIYNARQFKDDIWENQFDSEPVRYQYTFNQANGTLSSKLLNFPNDDANNYFVQGMSGVIPLENGEMVVYKGAYSKGLPTVCLMDKDYKVINDSYSPPESMDVSDNAGKANVLSVVANSDGTINIIELALTNYIPATSTYMKTIYATRVTKDFKILRRVALGYADSTICGINVTNLDNQGFVVEYEKRVVDYATNDFFQPQKSIIYAYDSNLNYNFGYVIKGRWVEDNIYYDNNKIYYMQMGSQNYPEDMGNCNTLTFYDTPDADYTSMKISSNHPELLAQTGDSSYIKGGRATIYVPTVSGYEAKATVNGVWTPIQDEVLTVSDVTEEHGIAGESNSMTTSSKQVVIAYVSDHLEHSVVFHSNGGTLITAQTVKDGATAELPDVPTKAHYNFEGWYINPECTKVYDFSSLVTSDVTLYAKWTLITKTIVVKQLPTKVSYLKGQTLDLSGAKLQVIYENNTSKLINITNDMISGYNKEKVGKQTVTITYNLKGTWFQVDVTALVVTFITNSSSKVENQSPNYNTIIKKPITPIKTGYTFVGWYKDSEGKISWNFASDKVTKNTTLYAKWSINQYLVSYNSVGGSKVKNTSAVYNSSIQAPAQPTRKNYTFLGWYKDSKYKVIWNFNKDKVIKEVILYAKWAKNPSVPVQLSISKLSSTSASISWNIVSGAKGYEVYGATSKSGKYTLLGTITGSRYTDKSLVKGKNYYYKVRAYIVVDNKKIYSEYTKIAFVKI